MRKIVVWVLAGLLLGVVLVGTQSPTRAADDQGKTIYTDKCLPCHGEKGDAKGPMAVCYSPPPGSFIDAKFWQGNVDQKIADSMTKGKGQMIPVDLKPEEIKAVTEYIKKAFKK
jgi:mono/diheme cytochrome c family protein